jgi:hypothetical protein
MPGVSHGRRTSPVERFILDQERAPRMKTLLRRYFFPALVFTALGEIVLFRFFEFGPQHIIAGVASTSLFACTAMEYVIPENRAWNYFTHASGMRWWMFGRELASMVFSNAFTAPLRVGSGTC